MHNIEKKQVVQISYRLNLVKKKQNFSTIGFSVRWMLYNLRNTLFLFFLKKWKTNRYAKIFNESGDFVVVSFMFWLKINGDVDWNTVKIGMALVGWV